MANDSKRTPAIEATIVNNDNGHPGGLVLRFDNGEILTLLANQLTNDILEHAVWHGLKQKLVDAAAISRNPDTGRSATVDDKYNAVREVYDRLLAGSWNKGRADGQATGSGGLLFRALCIQYPAKTPEALRAYLEKKTPKEKAALRGVPAIASIIDGLRNNGSDGDDGEALLAELGD